MCNNRRLKDLVEILVSIHLRYLSLFGPGEHFFSVRSGHDNRSTEQLTGNVATPPFALAGSFAPTQDEEDAANQEHRGNHYCQI